MEIKMRAILSMAACLLYLGKLDASQLPAYQEYDYRYQQPHPYQQQPIYYQQPVYQPANPYPQPATYTDTTVYKKPGGYQAPVAYQPLQAYQSSPYLAPPYYLQQNSVYPQNNLANAAYNIGVSGLTAGYPDLGGFVTQTKKKSTKTAKSGGHSYKPVVKKSKKKQKIISIDKGMHLPGGSQAFGKFKSLKSCMKACASSAGCFAGDYNPWLGKCYFHSNQTACGTMSAHSKLTHFKKVPCTIPDTSKFQVNLGSHLFGGILQKGIKSLADCIKKCVNAGSGLAPSPANLNNYYRGGQLCFGIDYDFSSHKCYFHTRLNTRPTVANLNDALPLCPLNNDAIDRPIDLTPNSGVVNIIICPANT